MLKKWLALSTTVLMLLSVTACGGGAADSGAAPAPTDAAAETEAAATEAAPAPEGATELLFWSQWEGAERDKFQALVDEYNNGDGAASNTFVKVEQVVDENMEMMMKLMAARLSNTMPDIVHVAQMSFIAMAKNDLFQAPPAEVQDYIVENYFDANAQLAEYNGTYWGYPTEHQVLALFWNKAHFDEVGLAGPPKTWDELRDYAQQLTLRDESGEMQRAGFLFTFDFSEAMMTQQISMFWGAGEDLFPTETTTNLASDVGKNLNQLFAGMSADGSTNANWLNWEDALANGQGSMVMMDPWALNFTVRGRGGDELYENIHVAELPTPDGTPGPSMSRGFELCVTSGSQNPDETWAFLKWLNEGPDCRMMNFMVNNFEFLPSHRGFEFPATWSQETKDVYARILEISKPQPDLSNYEEAQNAVDNMKDEIIISGKDPAQAAEDGAAEVTRILESGAAA